MVLASADMAILTHYISYKNIFSIERPSLSKKEMELYEFKMAKNHGASADLARRTHCYTI
jgi:hypothetical protein